MAKHTEIRVGDKGWVVRLQGKDVPVEILEKVKKAGGRGYEFKLKNTKTGRTITRGSGAIRRAGDPPRTPPAGFGSKFGSRRQAAPQSFGSVQFGSVQFGSQQPPPPPPPVRKKSRQTSSVKPNRSSLGSLRGRGRERKPPAHAPALARSAAPARPTKPEYPSKLAEAVCKAIMRSAGTEDQIRRVTADVLTEWNMKNWYGR